MSEIAFIKQFLSESHKSWGEAVEGLTSEQAHWRPYDSGNHIAFNLWHYTRTVDNIILFLFQRKPTVWMAGKWDEKFGMDSKDQGTGMETETAANLRIDDFPAFISYAREVWAEADSFMDNVTPEDMERIIRMRPFGELQMREILGRSILTHGCQHLGEVWSLKGLQGLPGNPL